MKHPFKVVVLGLHHDHVWSHLQDIRRSPAAELVGVADPNVPLLNQARERFSCPTYADYDELLETTEADIAYIFTNNRVGAYLAVSAANRDLHIMIEKPMGADLDGAKEADRVARSKGVQLMVNWPIAWVPAINQAITMATEGEIGRIWQVNYRAAHAGPQELGCSKHFCEWLFDERLNGGGALVDYACYGCALARTLLGMPRSVHAVSGNLVKETLPVEDNAIVLLDYPKASALAEASWSQQGNLTSYVVSIYGEKGTLIADGNGESTLHLATQEEPEGRQLEIHPLATNMRHATSHFTSALANNTPLFPLVSAEIGLDTQAILSAAKKAATQQGTPVEGP